MKEYILQKYHNGQMISSQEIYWIINDLFPFVIKTHYVLDQKVVWQIKNLPDFANWDFRQLDIDTKCVYYYEKDKLVFRFRDEISLIELRMLL